jgi:ethanolamine utilization cobalamin adenosyltransferase
MTELQRIIKLSNDLQEEINNYEATLSLAKRILRKEKVKKKLDNKKSNEKRKKLLAKKIKNNYKKYWQQKSWI